MIVINSFRVPDTTLNLSQEFSLIGAWQLSLLVGLTLTTPLNLVITGTVELNRLVLSLDSVISYKSSGSDYSQVKMTCVG